MNAIIDRYIAARRDLSRPLLGTRQVRDLTVFELSEDLLLVVAADSDGGIGPKPDDVVRVSAYECGRFGTRVPLMEILSSGSVPLAAFDLLAVELQPTGQEIIRGVKDELLSVGLPRDFPLSGSTEDNVPTKQTGMGVVVLGLAVQKDFRPGSSRSGDEVFCVGLPKSGPSDTISLHDTEIADGRTVLELSAVEGIHDILPVGSKGILYEAYEVARCADLKFLADSTCPLNMRKSAGPSTCCLVSAASGTLRELQQVVQKPVHVVGSIG
jgi:selenophosphate synthetase-related protein